MPLDDFAVLGHKCNILVGPSASEAVPESPSVGEALQGSGEPPPEGICRVPATTEFAQAASPPPPTPPMPIEGLEAALATTALTKLPTTLTESPAVSPVHRPLLQTVQPVSARLLETQPSSFLEPAQFHPSMFVDPTILSRQGSGSTFQSGGGALTPAQNPASTTPARAYSGTLRLSHSRSQSGGSLVMPTTVPNVGSTNTIRPAGVSMAANVQVAVAPLAASTSKVTAGVSAPVAASSTAPGTQMETNTVTPLSPRLPVPPQRILSRSALNGVASTGALTGIGASQTTVAIAAPGIIGVGTSSTGVLPSYRSGEILAPAGRPASMTIPATASRMSLGNVPSAPGMLVASPRGQVPPEGSPATSASPVPPAGRLLEVPTKITTPTMIRHTPRAHPVVMSTHPNVPLVQGPLQSMVAVAGLMR